MSTTTLHKACENGFDYEVQELIETEGIYLNPKDKLGKTPLHLACYRGRTSIVELLVKTKGVNLNPKDTDDRTPFHWACWCDHTSIVELLLKTKGVDLNPKDYYGYTPFHLVCEEGHTSIVELLIKTEGVELNPKDRDGKTPFHLVCEEGHTSIVELLIKTEGVDLNPKDKKGMTPFRYACDKGRTSIVELLIKTEGLYSSSFLFFDMEGEPRFDEVDVTSAPKRLFSEMKYNDSLTKKEEEILRKEETLAYKDHRDMDILMTAAHIGHFPIVKFLLSQERKGKIDINKFDKLNRSALMHAAYRGNLLCVSLLLNQNAKYKAKDRDGMNALMHAVMEGHLKVVEVLLNHDASQLGATNTWLRSAKSIANKYIKNTKKKDDMVALLSNYEKKECCSFGKVEKHVSLKLNRNVDKESIHSNEKNENHVAVKMTKSNEIINPLMEVEMMEGGAFVKEIQIINANESTQTTLQRWENEEDCDQMDEEEGASGCKVTMLQLLWSPFKCVVSIFSFFIKWTLQITETASFFFLRSLGLLVLGIEDEDIGVDSLGLLFCCCCAVFLLPCYFLSKYKQDSNHLEKSNFSLIRIAFLILVFFALASVIVSMILSLNDWNIIYQQSYTFNNTTTEPITCFTIHGAILQPYWIVAILSIFGQIMNSITSFLIKFGTTKESFNLSKPSQVGARISKLSGWMQLNSFVTICFYLNQAFGPNIPPSDPAALFSLMNAVNGSTSFDVTWLLKTSSHAPQSWRLYEQIYIKYLCGGVGMFLFTSYSNTATYKDKIFDVVHLKYLNKIEHSKIGLAVLLLLPALITHIVPMMFMFPHYVISFYALWWIVNKALDKLLHYCRCSSLLSFFIRAFKKLTFTFIITLIFQTLFVWAVLVYSLPFPPSLSQYLSIFWMELSMRNTQCYIQPYVNDFNRLESLACTHGVASGVSCNNNIGANEIVNLLSWMFSG